MKNIVTTAVLICLLAIPAASAQTDLRGQTNGGGQSTRSCVMQSSAAGFEVGAKGEARLSLSPKGQRFDVVVKASVPDGTILTVAVVRTDGRFADVGVIDMLMRVGMLSLDTFNNKSSAAFPVKGIETIVVSDGDTLLLKGKCARSSTKPAR